MREIRNARIESTMLGFEDHGMITAFVQLKWDGGSQAFGGYNLKHPAYGAAYIEGVLRAVGVDSWEKLKGAYCRVDAEHVRCHRIGHIVEDRWFDPRKLAEGKS